MVKSQETGLSASEILRWAIDECWEKLKEKERGDLNEIILG
jgi:hypothetical protein